MATQLETLTAGLYQAITKGRTLANPNTQDPVAYQTALTQAEAIYNYLGGGSGTYATQSWVLAQGYITAAALTPYLTIAAAATLYQPLNASLTDISAITGQTTNQVIGWNGAHWVAQTNGSGTVTTVSVVSANGFSGTVANATTTPAITLSTTITGILKGNGTAISAAVSGTDYAPATSGSAILYGNGGGGFSNVTIGGGLSFTAGTLSATGGGSVTSVSAGTGMSFTTITTSGSVSIDTTKVPYYSSGFAAIGLAKWNGTNWTIDATNYQPAISLTTIGTSGAATFSASILNIPQYQAAYTILSTFGALANATGYLYNNGSGTLSWATLITGVSSVSGTTNRITTSPTTGAVVVDISASYIGQSSITTLGTITTGTVSTGAIIGGVTMTLGSDATGDIYYRNSSGVLTRLGIGSSGQVLSVSGGLPSWAAASTSVALSAITAATGTNTINNADYAQVWSWNTLSSNTGLALSSSSTAATGNTQTLLSASLTGINANINQTTYAASFSNAHNQANGTNIALKLSATNNVVGANIGFISDAWCGINTTLPKLPLHVRSNDIPINGSSANSYPTFNTQYDNALFEGARYALVHMMTNGASNSEGHFIWDNPSTRLVAMYGYAYGGNGGNLSSAGFLWYMSSTTIASLNATGFVVGNGTTTATSTLQSAGSFGLKILTQTTSYTLTTTDSTIIFNGTSLTCTLPAASGCNGRIYQIININATTLTISAYLSYANVSTTTIAAASAVRVQSNGTSWYQIP